MKMLSLDKMATLEGGANGLSGRVCNSGRRLYQNSSLLFLQWVGCLIIRAYCPETCNTCGGDTC